VSLKLSKGNAKLGKDVYVFSLPAGYSCPGARDCKSRAVVTNGKAKVVDGKHTRFRCFAASQEAQYPATRVARWHNYELLKAAKTEPKMADLILSALPKKAAKIRIHASGDFFSQAYFDAWLLAAKMRKDYTFYAYTKSIKYWVKRIDKIPQNFILTASHGGSQDQWIMPCMRTATVVYSEQTAADLGLEIDHDDSLAMNHGPDFALLLHGTQPKGSDASKAKEKLKVVSNWTGYKR